jgi:hypothetical protein
MEGLGFVANVMISVESNVTRIVIAIIVEGYAYLKWRAKGRGFNALAFSPRKAGLR